MAKRRGTGGSGARIGGAAVRSSATAPALQSTTGHPSVDGPANAAYREIASARATMGNDPYGVAKHMLGADNAIEDLQKVAAAGDGNHITIAANDTIAAVRGALGDFNAAFEARYPDESWEDYM